MGQNCDDYSGFQPRITPPKHFSPQCKMESTLNDLGKKCAKGTDCPDDQVCNKLNCVSCEEGSKPDEDKENCTCNTEGLVDLPLLVVNNSLYFVKAKAEVVTQKLPASQIRILEGHSINIY